jgi:hypothetical protein
MVTSALTHFGSADPPTKVGYVGQSGSDGTWSKRRGCPYISVFPLFKKVLNPRSAPKGARRSKSVDTFRLHNVLFDEARHDGKEAYVVTVPRNIVA